MLHRALKIWSGAGRCFRPRNQRGRFRPCLEQLEDRAAPAVLTVNSVADNTAGDNSLTLREAILLVNGTLGRSLTAGEQGALTGTLGNNDAIQFNLPAPQLIALSGGALSVTRAVAITGPGTSSLTISGNNASRVFVVGQIWSRNLSLVVSLGGLTITGGSAVSGGNNYGGGVLNFGTLTINNLVFSGNAAGSSGGGGLYNVGALTLSNTTFSGNSASDSGTGASSGGGLHNNSSGTATVSNCTFSANSANVSGSGGGISNSGTLTVTNSTFTGNIVGSNGAGLHNSSGGTVTLTNSTLSNNAANSDGGGLDSDGTITVSNCTFSGNSAGSEGGGIDSHGTVQSISNSTFVGNTATSRGGAINSSGTMKVVNCTVTGNRVKSAGGGGGFMQTVPAKLFNTVVAGNFQGAAPSTTPNDIAGGNVDSTSSFNLIGSGGSGGMTNGVNNNQVGISNPGLGSLTSNGGPTQTVGLLLGSPAIDRGGNAYVSGATDQRGLARIVNGLVDIGACEVQTTTTAPADQNATVGVAASINLGSFADAYYAGSWNVDVNWGDGSPRTTFTTSAQGPLGTRAHTYQAQGTATVSVTVTDGNHDSSQATFHVITSSSGSGASSFTVANFPSPTTAGQAGTITVTAKDAFGNLASNYRGTVHFTSSDSQAVLPADYAFAAGDNAVHIFSVTFKTAGSQSLMVTDSAMAGVTGTQTGIVVYSAATSALAVSGFPSPITAGESGTFTVAAKDAFGNTVSGAMPRPDHVVIVVEENHSYGEIIGNTTEAPFLNSLAQAGAVFSNSFALTHPSQPNYLALFSGYTQGVTDNGDYFFTAPNLANALIDNALSFGGYSEDLPFAGYTGSDVGAYARRHSPWVSFTNVPSSTNLPFSSFPSDFSQLPTVSFVIPNINHDMHDTDGTIAAGDSWLQSRLEGYVQWAQTHNSLLVVTWDEDDSTASNQVPTIFRGPMIKPGTYSESINHYNVLRTIEDMYGLPYLGQAASAAPITDVYSNPLYTGTVQFTSNDSQAVLPAAYAFTSADAGVHTFSATLKTAGTLSLTATDRVNASINGTQAGITVNAATGAVCTVNSLADGNVADNALTLREAILLVNGTLGRSLTLGEKAQVTGTLGINDTIRFSLPAGAQTITLTGGALPITRAVTITGPGAGSLTINGSALDRVFVVGPIFTRTVGLVAAMSGLTISGGSQAYGGGLLNFGTLTVDSVTFANNSAGLNGGGGIYNVGDLTLSNCTLTGNSANGSATSSSAGGGIYNNSQGRLALRNCTLSGNRANGTGAGSSSGAAISNSGTLAVTDCVFSGNTATSSGGAIYSVGALTVANSTFSNNSSSATGGGIRSGGTLTVSNSTFAGNTASSEGGGISSSDTQLTVSNSTFAGNIAGSRGGGIAIKSTAGAATLVNTTITANRVLTTSSNSGGGLRSDMAAILRNTIIAGNFRAAAPSTTPDDVGASVDLASSFNLIGTGGSGGLVNGINNNQVGISNPGLGTLADNGGPTQTIALLPGSLAIDRGGNVYVTAGATDQRGFARIANATVDIGAFEVQTTSLALSNQSVTKSSAAPLNLARRADATGVGVDAATVLFSAESELPPGPTRKSRVRLSATLRLTPVLAILSQENHLLF